MEACGCSGAWGAAHGAHAGADIWKVSWGQPLNWEELKFKMSGPTTLSRVIWCVIIGLIIFRILAHWLLPTRG